MKSVFTSLFFFFFISGNVFSYTDPIGGRSSALSGASSTLTDVWSAQNNQAGLGFKRTFEAGVYYENRFLVKQLSTSAFAAALPIKRGCFGITYSGFGYSLYKESHLGIAYGMPLSENFSVGVQLSYLSTQIGDTYGRGQALTGSLGFQGKLGKKVIVAGHIFNPNRAKMTNYNNEVIPSLIKIGVQYLFSEKVSAVLEAEKSTYHKLNIKGGIEYAPRKELYLRAGASSFPASASFGLGVNLKGFKVDLSSAYHSILGFSPQMGLSYEF